MEVEKFLSLSMSKVTNRPSPYSSRKAQYSFIVHMSLYGVARKWRMGLMAASPTQRYSREVPAKARVG